MANLATIGGSLAIGLHGSGFARDLRHRAFRIDNGERHRDRRRIDFHRSYKANEVSALELLIGIFEREGAVLDAELALLAP
jgi:hypothetical protein